ncbi:MAG: redoxin domain-containing protein [Candidatus Poribacteria bacterium]|nr:redoxin domain-containing protein [Candidatus Poribacteria bacterium]
MRVTVRVAVLILMSLCVSLSAQTVGNTVGRRAPDFALQDTTGKTVRLSDYAGQPLIIEFYRGLFCPYCNSQLAEIQTGIGEFEALNVPVVAISVDPRATAAQMKRQLGLTYPLLSDPNATVISAYGVKEAFLTLARPATFVLDADHVIRWKHVGNDKTDRALVQNMLAEAERYATPVIVPHDIDSNGRIEFADLVAVARRFGQRVGGIREDVNGDGVVNIIDLVLVAQRIGG